MASTGEADKILDQLTLEEKVLIVSAADWWRTEPIYRGHSLLLPHIKVGSIQSSLFMLFP
jgi:hypothetical protein